MTELYTAAQLVLFPFSVLAVIIGAFAIAGMAVGLISGDAWKVVRNLVTAAGCTGAMWAYLMMPGGLG